MKQLNLVPIAGTKNRIFVEPLNPEKTTAGGIILTAKVDKRPTEGYIVGVSVCDEQGALPTLKVGDYVYFPDHVGKEFEWGANIYFVMKENEIFAKKI